MNPMSEAEIQLLIALIELAHPVETPNNNFYTFYPKTLAEAARYFRKFRVDWSEAYDHLQAKGYLSRSAGTGDESASLTAAGQIVAERLRAERPPIWYWYEQFFAEAPRSPAYASFCERLYGRALCQAGFSDMAQLDRLLSIACLSPQQRVLDLGCGAGMVAEYILDQTGARVTGVDYSPAAIREARTRTESKRDRLSFELGNLDDLRFERQSFDTLVSVDTLYMPNDLNHTLMQMHDLLAPHGQMLIYYSHWFGHGADARDQRDAQHTPLGQALVATGLTFDAEDWSQATYELMQRKRQIAESQQAAFAAEGRLFLYEHLLTESIGEQAPFAPQRTNMRRYLYHIH